MTARMKTLPKVDLSDQPDDESSELPEGWCRTSLDTIGTIYCGQSPATGDVNSNGEGTPYVTGPEQWDGQSIRANKWTTDPRRVVPDGCIFITVKGAGVGTLFPGDACAIGRDVYAFHPTPPISREFTQYALQRTIDLVVRQASGLIPGLTRDHLLEHGIAVPPLAEQRRIVAKLEELLGRVSRAKARLDRIPALLKRFRQSVLAAACSGKLTADWREDNPNTLPMPFSKHLGRSRKASRESEENIRGDSGLSVGDCNQEAPTRWVWTKLTDIARLETGHTPSRKHPEYWDGSIPWVGIKDARNHNGSVIKDTIQRVTELGLENSAARLLPRNTVCLTRTANSIGYTCILGREMATSQDLVGWICSEVIDPRYLMTLFLAEHDALYRFARGSAHPTVYFPEILAFHVCLPPLAEQHEIVKRVERLFAFADQIEARLTKAQAQVDRLTQSILAKAFRGELVPTEAELARREGRDYEPASKLLERVRAQQPSSATPTRKRRTAKS